MMISNIKKLLNRFGKAACKVATIAGVAAATVAGPATALARSKEHFMHHSGQEAPKTTNAKALGGMAASDLEFVNLKDQLGEKESLEQFKDIKAQIDAIKAKELKDKTPDIEN